jgi:hypothetical protein
VIHNFRSYREHEVSGCDERGDEQSTIGLDPDDHLTWILDVGTDHVVEARDPVHAFGKSSTPKAFSVLIHHVHVVMGLGPVHSDKDHPAPLIDGTFVEPEDPSSSLMDKCSRHDIPPAV